MNHDGYKHLDRLASMATGLLWINIPLVWLIALSSVGQFTVNFDYNGKLLMGRSVFDLLQHGHNAISLITVVVCFFWYHRACANARRLNPGVLEYGPIDGIALWFIPLINFLLPCTVMIQLWQASTTQPMQLPKSKKLLVVAWWSTLITAYVTSMLIAVAQFYSVDQKVELEIISCPTIILTVSVYLLTRVITRITNDQNRTFAVKLSESVQSTTPAIESSPDSNTVDEQSHTQRPETITFEPVITMETKHTA